MVDRADSSPPARQSAARPRLRLDRLRPSLSPFAGKVKVTGYALDAPRGLQNDATADRRMRGSGEGAFDDVTACFSVLA